jgi:hypothetical protein
MLATTSPFLSVPSAIRHFGGVFAPYLLITRRSVKRWSRCCRRYQGAFSTRLHLGGRWCFVLFDLNRADTLHLLECESLVISDSKFVCWSDWCFGFRIFFLVSLVSCFGSGVQDSLYGCTYTKILPCGVYRMLWRCLDGACGLMVYVPAVKLMIKRLPVSRVVYSKLYLLYRASRTVKGFTS